MFAIQNPIHDATPTIKTDGSARARHACNDMLAMRVDQTDDRIFVGRESDGSAPFVRHFHWEQTKVPAYFAHKIMRNEPRRAIAAGVSVRQARFVGAQKQAIVVIAIKPSARTERDARIEACLFSLGKGELGLLRKDDVVKLLSRTPSNT